MAYDGSGDNPLIESIALAEGHSVPPDRSNPFTSVGFQHNRLVIDFARSHPKGGSAQALVEFVQAHHERYGIRREHLPPAAVIENEYKMAHHGVRIEKPDQAIDYLSERLPEGVDRTAFARVMTGMLSAEDVRTFNRNYQRLYDPYIATVDEKNRPVMQAFFSVLRHSANLWRS